MKRLFQSLSKTEDGAFIIDGRHRIIFWNPAAEAILGYTAGEVTGLQCYEILGGRDEQGRTLCQQYCQIAIQAQQGDVLPNKDVRVHTHTGEDRWINVTTFAYPVEDKATGQVIVHLFRDSTAQKSYQDFVSQVLSASEQLRQTDNGSQATAAVPVVSNGNSLTEREWQILELLAQGLDTNEIASTLIISPSTVRNHVQNILGKLGVHSRLEAIAYVYQHGLMENSANNPQT
jgi:PAS domain S-box-containing protein